MNSDLANKRRRLSEPYVWNTDIEEATGRAFNWHCPFCNADLKETGYHKAHVFPVGYGIGMTPGSVVLSCPTCNMNMHDTPAWEWCANKGIAYGHIQFTLEILRRIFVTHITTEIHIERKIVASVKAKPKEPDATRKATAYLLENSAQFVGWNKADLVRQLQSIGVGKSTAYNVVNEFLAGNLATRHDGEQSE